MSLQPCLRTATPSKRAARRAVPRLQCSKPSALYFAAWTGILLVLLHHPGPPPAARTRGCERARSHIRATLCIRQQFPIAACANSRRAHPLLPAPRAPFPRGVARHQQRWCLRWSGAGERGGNVCTLLCCVPQRLMRARPLCSATVGRGAGCRLHGGQHDGGCHKLCLQQACW